MNSFLLEHNISPYRKYHRDVIPGWTLQIILKMATKQGKSVKIVDKETIETSTSDSGMKRSMGPMILGYLLGFLIVWAIVALVVWLLKSQYVTRQGGHGSGSVNFGSLVLISLALTVILYLFFWIVGWVASMWNRK
jgi:hypothetical protein